MAKKIKNPTSLSKDKQIELAKNSKSPKELNKLSKSKDSAVRNEVAKNINAGKMALTDLLYDADSTQEIYLSLASNPNINNVYDFYYLLDVSSDDLITERMINNPSLNISLETINKIYRLSKSKISFASWHKCPKNILEDLSTSKDVNILFLVAKNPNASVEALKKIIEGANQSNPESIALFELIKRFENKIDDIRKILLLTST